MDVEANTAIIRHKCVNYGWHECVGETTYFYPCCFNAMQVLSQLSEHNDTLKANANVDSSRVSKLYATASFYVPTYVSIKSDKMDEVADEKNEREVWKVPKRTQVLKKESC